MTITTNIQATNSTVVTSSSTATTSSQETTSKTLAGASVANWLFSAQNVMKEQTKTEYALQNTSLNEMDYQNQLIDAYNQKYSAVADKMGEKKKVKGLSAWIVPFIWGVVGIGALSGNKEFKASWKNLETTNMGNGLTAKTKLDQDATDLQKLSAKGQTWVSKMQSVQTQQNKSSSIMQNHSQAATASQNNFMNLINFQQKLTAKF